MFLGKFVDKLENLFGNPAVPLTVRDHLWIKPVEVGVITLREPEEVAPCLQLVVRQGRIGLAELARVDDLAFRQRHKAVCEARDVLRIVAEEIVADDAIGFHEAQEAVYDLLFAHIGGEFVGVIRKNPQHPDNVRIMDGIGLNICNKNLSHDAVKTPRACEALRA